MMKVKVNSRNQIVIPAQARKKLGIKPGDSILLQVGEHSILVLPEPDDHVEALRGLGKEIWADVDSEDWLQRERDSWEE